MINVIKNIKKVLCVVMWLFCMIYARKSNERIIPMDISVYNGEGSILLNWTIPDSIKAKNDLWGIRSIEEVSEEAKKNSFCQKNIIRMPANNFSVIYKKVSC